MDNNNQFQVYFDRFWDLIPKSWAILVISFAIATAYHDTQTTYVGGVLSGILFIIGLRAFLKNDVNWHLVLRYSWQVILGIILYFALGTLWALFRLPYDIQYARDLPDALTQSLRECYESSPNVSCYLNIQQVRERIFVYITFFPMNMVAFICRDPLKTILNVIVDYTSDWFYARIHSAVSFRFAQ